MWPAVAVLHAVGRFSIASHANDEFRETRKSAKQYANSKLPVLTYRRPGFPRVAKLTAASARKSPLFLRRSFICKA